MRKLFLFCHNYVLLLAFFLLIQRRYSQVGPGFASKKSLPVLKSLLIAMTLGFFLFVQQGNAQTTKTVGTSGNYTTLKAAFDAINNGTITGSITLQITSNTTESATAALNASGTGSASYSSISIYPTGLGYSISGSLAAPIINF